MGIQMNHVCDRCFLKWTTYDGFYYHRCDLCVAAMKRRADVGSGDYADMIFALFWPREYERDQANRNPLWRIS